MGDVGPVVMIMFGIVGAPAASGSLHSSIAKGPDGTPRVTIENALYRTTFNPSLGGRCSSFVVKRTGREWVYKQKTGGLFTEHFARESHPGEFWYEPYEWKVVREGGRVGVRLWRTARGKKIRHMAGLVVEKTVWLRTDAAHVDCDFVVRNPLTESRSVGFWIQHCFWLGQSFTDNYYYRPSTNGIKVSGVHRTIGQKFGEDWVKRPTAGWSAARNDRTHEGVVFLMDYDMLDILYNATSACTLEWFTDDALVPKGRSWQTTYTMIPVDGFTGFVHASGRLIANVTGHKRPGRTEIVHQLRGAKRALGPVRLHTEVHALRSKKRLAQHDAAARVGLQVVNLCRTFDVRPTEPLLVKVTAAGEGWTERYEAFYDPTPPMQAWVGVPPWSEYSVPKPPKRKTFVKPELDKLTVGSANGRTDVLVFFGLYTNQYGIEPALGRLGAHRVQVSDAPSTGAAFLPSAFEEMFAYDLVVLSNVNAKALGLFGMELVYEYVRHGGGVLILGGQNAFGHGEFRATRIETLSPVIDGGPFDLKWNPDGWRLTPGAPHAVRTGVDFGAPARVYWAHRTRAKPDTTVVLTFDGSPALVLGRFGKGRVAAFTGSVLGEPRPGRVPFWRSEAWGKLLGNVIEWVRVRP